jgi:hypothetical protein
MPLLIIVLALALATYWPSLRFGFFWDDPLWFQRMAGRDFLALIAPQPDFQFYRPATFALSGAFQRADGTFDPFVIHAWQISVHLLNVLLVYALCRALGLARRTAWTAALLFAVFPLAHQVVAWTQALAPSGVTACLLGAACLFARSLREPDKSVAARVSLAAALALYVLALAFQESAAPIALVFPLLAWHLVRVGRVPSSAPFGDADRLRIPRWRWSSVAFAAITAPYLALWVLVPKAPSFTHPQFVPEVAAYLAQGIAYPVLGRPDGWAAPALAGPVPVLPGQGQALPLPVIGAIAVVIVVWLALAAWRRPVGAGLAPALAGPVPVLQGQGQALPLLALAWYVAALLPGWAGLPPAYALLSSRMFYPAAFGVVVLWAGLVEPPGGLGRLARVWSVLAWTLMAAIVLQSVVLLAGFNDLYALGARQMDALVAWSRPSQAGAPGGLFVNFPDRYTARRAPYPLGYWGVTLAPVSVELGAFPAIVNGVEPETASWSVPALDDDMRQASPYAFDLRGVALGPEELYTEAQNGLPIVVTRYQADGTMRLWEAGRMLAHPGPPPVHALARFGDTLYLAAAHVEEQAPGEWTLDLAWQCRDNSAWGDTVLVHLGLPGQPPVAQADGDFLEGLLPLSVCRPGQWLSERRHIPVPPGGLLPGATVRVGVYNRETGQRLPGVDQDGAPLLDDLWTVP